MGSIVTSDGVRLHYEERGSGRPLLMIRAGNAEFVAEALPGARVEVFHASGHCPFIDEADRFNQIVGEFARAGADRPAVPGR